MMTPEMHEQHSVLANAAFEQSTRLMVSTQECLETVNRFLTASRARHAAAKALFEQQNGAV